MSPQEIVAQKPTFRDWTRYYAPFFVTDQTTVSEQRYFKMLRTEIKRVKDRLWILGYDSMFMSEPKTEEVIRELVRSNKSQYLDVRVMMGNEPQNIYLDDLADNDERVELTRDDKYDLEYGGILMDRVLSKWDMTDVTPHPREMQEGVTYRRLEKGIIYQWCVSFRLGLYGIPHRRSREENPAPHEDESQVIALLSGK